MATTVELNTIFDVLIQSPIRTYASPAVRQPAVLAATKLLAGTMIMNDAGVLKKCASAVAGSSLMGVLQDTLDNSAAGGNVQFDAIFRRGTFWVTNYAANPVVAADLGKLVAIQDENQVKHTIVTDDLTVQCVSISSDGTQVQVRTV